MKEKKDKNEWVGPVAMGDQPTDSATEMLFKERRKSSVSLEIFLLVCPGGSYQKSKILLSECTYIS